MRVGKRRIIEQRVYRGNGPFLWGFGFAVHLWPEDRTGAHKEQKKEHQMFHKPEKLRVNEVLTRHFHFFD